MNGGGLAHCTLPVGSTSKPVYHRTVEEIWYFFEGQGQVWRKQDDREKVVDVHPGLSLTIPTETHFQFRNTGTEPLKFISVTMPPWPGEDEAVALEEGKWPLSQQKKMSSMSRKLYLSRFNLESQITVGNWATRGVWYSRHPAAG